MRLTRRLVADGTLQVGFSRRASPYITDLRGFFRQVEALVPFELEPRRQLRGADVRVRFTRRVPDGFDGYALPRRYRWDVLIRPGLGRATAEWLLGHELGHVLGLRHPKNHRLTRDSTIMAYPLGRLPSGAYLRRRDRDKLTGTWGKT